MHRIILIGTFHNLTDFFLYTKTQLHYFFVFSYCMVPHLFASSNIKKIHLSLEVDDWDSEVWQKAKAKQ